MDRRIKRATRCEVHDLAIGPEGACVVCRRTVPPPRVLRASSWIAAAGVALLSLVGVALRHRQRPVPTVFAAPDHFAVEDATPERRGDEPPERAVSAPRPGGALVGPPPQQAQQQPAPAATDPGTPTGSMPAVSAEADDDDGVVVGEREREPENPAMWSDPGALATTGGVLLRRRHAVPPAPTVILVYDSVREVPPPRPVEGVSGTRGTTRPRRAGRW